MSGSGDHERDFGTYPTELVTELGRCEHFLALTSDVSLAFVCTIQQAGLRAKIVEGVRKVMTDGSQVTSRTLDGPRERGFDVVSDASYLDNLPSMPTWIEAVEALERPTTLEPTEHRHWLPWNHRTPILITGSAGAGKTEIWRQLTQRSAPDQRSGRPDEGYSFLPGRRKRTLTITTIPGQTSAERFRDMKWFFGESTILEGVIFVATFGFDTIWPDEAEEVASSTSPLNIDTLSDRNIGLELDSFRETCGKLSEKRLLTDGRVGPHWLLVLVNKVDLYWDGIRNAQNYYARGCDSVFDRIAQTLIRQVGPWGSFRYDVLPVTLNPQDYSFASNSLRLGSATQLGSPHADASRHTLLRVLGDLCGT